ncbi:hypothetical protein AOR13_2387 [Alteromonas stellipolaris LMG 21856]|nr:hypothetical protein AOR13_2387 [Alteromonas stellipolaris LMG 21856]
MSKNKPFFYLALYQNFEVKRRNFIQSLIQGSTSLLKIQSNHFLLTSHGHNLLGKP